MAREKVDNKLNVVIGTKAQVEADNTIPDNSIVIVTDEELKANEIVYDDDKNIEEAIYERTNMVNVTYQELKDLRDNEELVSGTFYRITDYETTTIQTETRSAGNLFDVIVQALDNKTLSENAQAIHSARDVSGYFNGVDLSGWKLKYKLDNDNELYYWVDTVNGKGVIYQMIDEFGNDLPYDFKNIQFKRYKIETYAKNTDLENRYYASKSEYGIYPSDATIDDNDFIWAYTFTVIDENGIVNDVSLNKNKTFVTEEGIYYYTKNNKIGSFDYGYYDEIEETEKIKEALGNNVILYDYPGYWEFYGFSSNTIGNEFNYNTIGNEFNYNTIGNRFYYNTIGDGFVSNTIGNGFVSNTIGNGFSSNTIVSGFDGNTIRNGFSDNNIVGGFGSNIIGNYFSGNTIRNGFSGNNIGNEFNSNTIGYSFKFNTIGDSFKLNMIGDSFESNTIGNYFNYNTIGNKIVYITFSFDGKFSSQIRYLYLKNGLTGASSANKLDLYYSGLYHRLYPTTIERIANGNIVSIHQETPLVWTGKKKTSNTSSTWEDI